jgi:hypothetical protein
VGGGGTASELSFGVLPSPMLSLDLLEAPARSRKKNSTKREKKKKEKKEK